MLKKGARRISRLKIAAALVDWIARSWGRVGDTQPARILAGEKIGGKNYPHVDNPGAGVSARKLGIPVRKLEVF